jgi:hypothetical protein
MCPAPASTNYNSTTVSSDGESNTTIGATSGASSTDAVQSSTLQDSVLVADEPLLGLYIAIGIALFLIAVGTISFLIWRRRQGQQAAVSEAAGGDVPLRDDAMKSAPKFDPNARYGSLNDVGDATYDMGDFPMANER